MINAIKKINRSIIMSSREWPTPLSLRSSLDCITLCWMMFRLLTAVLNRYPIDNLPGFDLPDRVAMFCLPLGAVVESWPVDAHHPAPVFSTFVLTAAASEGDRVYGAAVMFYEVMDEACLDDVQRQQLLPLSDDSTQPPSHCVVAQNKSICLLSRYPFFDAFKQFLVYLYRMSLASSPPHPAPIERYVVSNANELVSETSCDLSLALRQQ